MVFTFRRRRLRLVTCNIYTRALMCLGWGGMCAVTQAYRGHANFSKSRLATNLEFTVHHYAGQVIYNAAGFIEKNRDQLQVCTSAHLDLNASR